MTAPQRISYDVAIDKDGDGFVGWDVDATDAANLIPTPVTWDGFDALTINGTSPTVWLETAYGLRALHTAFDVGAAGLFIGRDVSNINAFAVTPGQTYSAGLWVRADTDLSSVPLSLTIYNQALVGRGAMSVSIGTAWQQISVTFTAVAGDTHITLAVEKPSATPGIAFIATGIMLVAGSTLPATFNAGDPVGEAADVITRDVLSVESALGMRRPFDVVAAPLRARIILDNSGGRYAPERGHDWLRPGTRVKVRAHYDAMTYPLVYGWVDHVSVDPGDLAGRRAVLHLYGPGRIMDQTHLLFELLLNASPTDVLASIFTQPPLHRLNTAFLESDERFAYVGDTWADGLRASRAVAQIMAADRGRFFSDRENQLVYQDRGTVEAYRLTDETISNAFDALEYVYGDWLINAVRVEVRPRSVGAPGSTLWTLGTAQPVDPGTANCRVIVARFRDTNGDSVGATAVITPVAGVDYSANTAPDGTGMDVTAQVSVTLIDGGSASAAYLELCNTGGARAYLLAGATLRGTPLYQEDTALVERRDEASIAAYGLHSVDYDLPYFVDVAEATAMADTILVRQARPFGVAGELHLSSRTHPCEVLALSLLDRVTVREDGTGHSADYHIVGERHTVDRGGARHRVTWLLEPVNPGGVWQLDQGKLGTSTYLAVG